MLAGLLACPEYPHFMLVCLGTPHRLLSSSSAHSYHLLSSHLPVFSIWRARGLPANFDPGIVIIAGRKIRTYTALAKKRKENLRQHGSHSHFLVLEGSE